MIDIPDMPADWWPDEVMLRATTTTAGEPRRQLDLCMLIRLGDLVTPEIITYHTDDLRRALWQAKHNPQLAEEIGA
jgi:hypothetical protein